MTAIGFIMLLAGVFLVRVYGTMVPLEYNNADLTGGALFTIGCVLFVSGIALWLWNVMP